MKNEVEAYTMGKCNIRAFQNVLLRAARCLIGKLDNFRRIKIPHSWRAAEACVRDMRARKPNERQRANGWWFDETEKIK